MLVLTDTYPAISSEDFLQFEEILGKKLPKSMMDFYLKHNGGQPLVMGVHDEHHLFPFNSFDSLEEVRKSLIGEKMPELSKAIDFDPEGSMFCAYSSKVEALARFALGLKEFVMIPTL